MPRKNETHFLLGEIKQETKNIRSTLNDFIHESRKNEEHQWAEITVLQRSSSRMSGAFKVLSIIGGLVVALSELPISSINTTINKRFILLLWNLWGKNSMYRKFTKWN